MTKQKHPLNLLTHDYHSGCGPHITPSLNRALLAAHQARGSERPWGNRVWLGGDETNMKKLAESGKGIQTILLCLRLCQLHLYFCHLPTCKSLILRMLPTISMTQSGLFHMLLHSEILVPWASSSRVSKTCTTFFCHFCIFSFWNPTMFLYVFVCDQTWADTASWLPLFF